MIAKCGRKRVHHWAHRTANCDKWGERETAWHRNWKNEFPEDYQEIRMEDLDGDVHIADVRLPNNTVIEFQHSYLPEAERRSREDFYNPMVWIVDGTRNARDVSTFADFLSVSSMYCDEICGLGLPLRPIKLVDNWIRCVHPVYLDFGDAEFPAIEPPPERVLWRVREARTYRFVATPFLKQSVIDHYTLGSPLEAYDFRRIPRSDPRFG